MVENKVAKVAGFVAASSGKFAHCVVSVTRIIVPDSGAVVKHFLF